MLQHFLWMLTVAEPQLIFILMLSTTSHYSLDNSLVRVTKNDPGVYLLDISANCCICYLLKHVVAE